MTLESSHVKAMKSRIVPRKANPIPLLENPEAPQRTSMTKKARASATILGIRSAVPVFSAALVDITLSRFLSERSAANEQTSEIPKIVNRGPKAPGALSAAVSEGGSKSTERRYEPITGASAHPIMSEAGKDSAANNADSASASRVILFQLNPTALRRAINGSLRP